MANLLRLDKKETSFFVLCSTFRNFADNIVGYSLELLDSFWSNCNSGKRNEIQ